MLRADVAADCSSRKGSAACAGSDGSLCSVLFISLFRHVDMFLEAPSGIESTARSTRTDCALDGIHVSPCVRHTYFVHAMPNLQLWLRDYCMQPSDEVWLRCSAWGPEHDTRRQRGSICCVTCDLHAANWLQHGWPLIRGGRIPVTDRPLLESWRPLPLFQILHTEHSNSFLCHCLTDARRHGAACCDRRVRGPACATYMSINDRATR